MPIIENDIKLDFKDVLIKPKRSTLNSRKQVSLERTIKLPYGKYWKGVPIASSNMDTVGTFSMCKKLTQYKMLTCLHKHYQREEYISFFRSQSNNDLSYSAYTLGSDQKEYEQFIDLQRNLEHRINLVCLDVANGYTESFIHSVSRIRETYSDITIIAGNVVTPEITEQLILAGADIVKIGIGNGSVCTTRIQTGIGYPQVSALIECADAAHGLNGKIMSCGGCTCPGDIAKAFATGADFVMLGGMLAGHLEGEVKPVEGKIPFYGMSSETAMKKYRGGISSYRSAEGKTVNIDFKENIENTLQDILGGLRSTCTYVGAKELKELPKRATFIKVNNQYNNIYD